MADRFSDNKFNELIGGFGHSQSEITQILHSEKTSSRT